jgi:hypothetical protein
MSTHADDPADATALIARLEDEHLIHKLIARLSHLADRGTIDEYLALWAPDGEWHGSADVARGTAQLHERIKRYRAAGVQGPGSGTRHVSTTRYVELLGAGRARADSYFVYFAGLPDTPRAARVGRYEDTVVRIDGQWRLANRRIVLDD